MQRVVVTGASGFVGRALVDRLAQQRFVAVRAALRQSGAPLPAGVEPFVIPDLSDVAARRRDAVAGCTVVVHTAARVHVMRETAADAAALFRRVNRDATLALAREAAAAGVRRFVFLSSIKVNGERTAPGAAFTAEDPANPQDPYAISKHEAELGLRQIASESGLQVVIIRPPLVYGPGVRANFAALLRAIERGVPLPLGAVRNRRSLIALDNLVDFLLTCMRHPAAANRTFVVCDGRDLSTPELVRAAAAALGRPARLLPVPAPLLMAAARLSGRRAAIERLCGDLRIDDRKARELLGWAAPIGVEEALRRTVAGLRRTRPASS